MKRLAVLTAMALTACASAEPEPPMLSAQPASAPGGDWIVVEDYAVEAVGALKSPYLGQTLTLDADRAIDPAGRLCKAPAYSQAEAPAAEGLGHPKQPQAAQDPAPRRTVAIACDGHPFATLVSQPDGTWLTRANSWVLKLAKAEPKPAPQPVAEAAPPAPAVDHAAHHAAPAAPARKEARTLVYLASYKTEKSAKDGFKVLAKASAILAKQQPITQTVDLGKKGTWVRLYGMAADEAERTKICGQLGKRVDECGARNRE